MKTIKLLEYDWSYPVCQHPMQLRLNIENLLAHIRGNCSDLKPTQIVAIGTSGAMLLGAAAALFYNSKRYTYVLLRKQNDDTAQGRNYVDLNSNQIIIIDDHITDGRTMRKIAAQLKELGVLKQVVGVVARCWGGDNPDYFNKITTTLTESFPSIKFWIH